MAQSLELEIKSLLDETGDPAAVTDRVVPLFDNDPDMKTSENIAVLLRFLLNSGQFTRLIDWVTQQMTNENDPVPWPYLLEAAAGVGDGIDNNLGHLLLEGIEATDGFTEASRSRALDFTTPRLKSERADRRLQAVKAYRRQKDVLLEQLVTLRTQQLFEQEKKVLSRLQRMFPNDADIIRESLDHRERHALDILFRYGRSSRWVSQLTATDPEVEAVRSVVCDALVEAAHADPDLAADFAVAAAALENWEAALKALEPAPLTASAVWLRLELLLGARRYLELLDELIEAERLLAEDSETFFVTAYLRAQSLWGLGQKDQAIEVMESILSARPHYRLGSALLGQWRRR